MAGWGRLSARFKSRRSRAAAAALLALFLAFCAVSARLFVFPDTGMPEHVDAIVVLGGSGDRLDLGMRLAREGRAPYLVLSYGVSRLTPSLCRGHVGRARVICFWPDPVTTQGEARIASRIAREHGWDTIVLVTTQDQVWRAHLRFERCYDGRIYGVGSAVPWYLWPYAIGYQWAGTVKAETLQRGC